MSQFPKLLRLLQKELSQQEKLLALLSKERAAIVKLNQEEIDRLATEKAKVLEGAMGLEAQRAEVYASVCGSLQNEKTEPLKFADVVQQCEDRNTKQELTRVGAELKSLVSSVKQINDGNGDLIKQCMGLIATTVSILTSKPDTDLPTYGSSGKLKGDEDPAFASRKRLTSRSA